MRKFVSLDRRAKQAVLGSILLIAFVVGCQVASHVTPTSTSTPAPALAVSTTSAQRGPLQSGATTAENQSYVRNCYQGEPKLTYDPPGIERRLAHPGYAVLFSSYLRVPLWVSEYHSKTDFTGPGNRADKFLADPLLPGDESPTNADYARSGYDRGHQAAAAMFKQSQSFTNDSFYFSNMAPQVGANFNRGIWAKLEDESRQIIEAAGEGWVITGSLFYNPHDAQPTTAKGIASAHWIGKGRVAVPTHFYKIVVTRNAKGETHCYAFVLANQAVPNAPAGKGYDWHVYQRKVSEIEQLAGLNFMPNLTPGDRKRLEDTLELVP